MVDIVIIGAGPAGFTAGIYSARAGLTTILFTGKNPGGQLVTTTIVENFPGFPDGVDGFTLIDNMQKQAVNFGVKVLYEAVEKVEKSEKGGFLILPQNILTKAVIIATGSTAKKLSFPGSDQFWHSGISACAVCDGALPMFRNKPIAVIGGGDSAMEEAQFLSKFASKVYIIHRGPKFRASVIMQKRVLSNPKIGIIYNSEVVKAEGKELLETITISTNGVTQEFSVSGLFYAIGHTPATEFLTDIEKTATGHIVTHSGTYTSIPGIFACGDVQDNIYKQAITAAGSGCQAALDAYHWLEQTA